MLWFGKIREDAKAVFKEHPASILSCFAGFLILGVIDDILSRIGGINTAREVLSVIADFCFAMTPAFALCESHLGFSRNRGESPDLKDFKKSVIYIIVLLISAGMSGRFAYIKYDPANHISTIFDFDVIGADNPFMRFFFVYLAACIIGAVYFLYKKSGESFESYFVKGFLGTMKGELAYGVVLLGGLCIVWVFQTLIYDIDAIAIVVALISGAMAYPAVLIALSRPGEKVSKFGKIMMGYVFPGFLAAAFIILYVYILKIVFTWKFPSNEAFAIVTALFISGIFFWSMAQGCTEGRYNQALRIMPMLFIPFIVIQIICLYMRIAQYGLTQSRYFGILLIVFEVLYEVIYILRFLKGKGMEWILFPVVLGFVLIALIVPGVNVCAAITGSQGKVVERFIEDTLSGKELSSADKAMARSAYKVINREAGFEGSRFIKKLGGKFPEFDLKAEFDPEGSDSEDYVSSEYYSADNDITGFDTLGYKHVEVVEFSSYDYDEAANMKISDTKKVELRHRNEEEPYAEIDLSETIDRMRQLHKNGAVQFEYDKVIEDPIIFDDGSLLYITYISFDEQKDVLTHLYLNGFYLH